MDPSSGGKQATHHIRRAVVRWSTRPWDFHKDAQQLASRLEGAVSEGFVIGVEGGVKGTEACLL